MWKDNDNEKGPLRFRPLPKEDGCRFYGHKPFGVKATVGKDIIMMHFSPLSPEVWFILATDSVSWKQNHNENKLNYRVTYPNGFGLSIIKSRHSRGGKSDLWEVRVLKGGKHYVRNGAGYVRTHCSDEEVVICHDLIRNL